MNSAIILAAGSTSDYANIDFYRGSRSSFLKDSAERVEKEMKQIEPPKCLFKCKGQVLLKRQVSILRTFGIESIKIITDFKEDMIKEFDERQNLGLEFIHSPDFRKPFIGLWKAIDQEQDCLLVLGDVYLTKNSVEKLINQKGFVGASSEENHPWLLCKIPDTTKFLTRYANALTYWLSSPQKAGGLENLYNRVWRLFDSELLALYWVFFNYGASTIIDPDLLDLDIYEMTDDYNQRWGVEDIKAGDNRTISVRVKDEDHSLKYSKLDWDQHGS